MDRITSSLLETFSTQYEIESLDEATRFEHFCNYCVTSKIFRGSFSLDDIHTGGGGDSSIDGIALIVNGRIILDEDELREIVESTSHLDADVVFIQAKTSSSFDGSAIGTFIHGVKDFLSDEPGLAHNEQIKKARSSWDQVIAMSSYMVNRRPICRLFYGCTGKWVDDQNLLAILESGRRELDDIGLFEAVAIQPMGATEVQRLYHDTKNKLSTTVMFQNRITLPDIEGVSEGYLGIIQMTEYLKLVQDENETIHSIFDDNVRDFQGINQVNGKIKETLEQSKFDLFSVLNNGITLVASSITAAGNRFTIRDYQIVNGCQTSHVLHQCRNIPGIENVNVPIKVVVTENEDVKARITLATNSQTAVKPEQLEALTGFQKKLELYFAAENNDVELHYERRSQQYNSDARIKKTQIISIPIQIKSFASMFLNSPHLVSGYYGTIVRRFSGQIFGDEHKLSPYYVSALAFFRVEQFFRSGELDSKLKKGRYHLMLLVRLIGMGANLSAFNSNRMERDCEAFRVKLANESDALVLFKKAQKLFEESGIDLDKSQYKSEADTELLVAHYNAMHPGT